jgi:hypothetical protein
MRWFMAFPPRDQRCWELAVFEVFGAVQGVRGSMPGHGTVPLPFEATTVPQSSQRVHW